MSEEEKLKQFLYSNLYNSYTIFQLKQDNLSSIKTHLIWSNIFIQIELNWFSEAMN